MTRFESLRDHWWWRPGWRAGRSFYTWHVTFADQPGVQQLVTDYAPVLAVLPQLDPVSARWLHLTMQGIGFTDEVDRNDVDRIVEAARTRCAGLWSFTVTFGPAHVDRETIQMRVHRPDPLVELRLALRAVIGDVWGPGNVPDPEAGFRPHVSLGYCNATGPAEPVVEILRAHEEHEEYTAEVTVSSVSLIDLNRDHRMYEWTDVATVPLGPQT
ncbi:2'-5' RNA ligase family protein [Actinosynnema sp. CS-041913]|uniref:2'-5' RNA ligase family protein n=1 Tax=Actinosynnema sp. CS-041913 TaxID=3239917 RepID=UPI003D8D8472